MLVRRREQPRASIRPMKGCRSALLCGIATSVFIFAPSVISADETVPEVTLVAEHGGFVVSDCE